MFADINREVIKGFLIDRETEDKIKFLRTDDKYLSMWKNLMKSSTILNYKLMTGEKEIKPEFEFLMDISLELCSQDTRYLRDVFYKDLSKNYFSNDEIKESIFNIVDPKIQKYQDLHSAFRNIVEELILPKTSQILVLDQLYQYSKNHSLDLAISEEAEFAAIKYLFPKQEDYIHGIKQNYFLKHNQFKHIGKKIKKSSALKDLHPDLDLVCKLTKSNARNEWTLLREFYKQRTNPIYL